MSIHRGLPGGQDRWDDLRFPFTGNRIDVSAGRIDYDYTECTVDFQANARYPNEPVCVVAQMPHHKLPEGPLRPHLHWYQEEAVFPNWLLAYRWYNNGDLVPGSFTLAAMNGHAFTWSSGVLLQITTFPEIPGLAGENVSSICDLIVYRDNANASALFAGSDTYGVAKTKELDLHYQVSGWGSRQEFTP